MLVCAQTDGAEYQTEPLRDCDEISGLTMRSIERIPFDDRDGNTQGYAHERKVAVSPVGAISTRQSARPFAWGCTSWKHRDKVSLAVLDGLLAVLPSTEGTGRSAWLMKYFDPVSVGVALTIVRRKVI